MDRKMWTPRSMRNATAAVTGLWLPKSARERRLNDKAPAHVPNRAEIRRGLRALRKSGESYTQSPHAAVKVIVEGHEPGGGHGGGIPAGAPRILAP